MRTERILAYDTIYATLFECSSIVSIQMVVQGTKEKQMNERTKFEPAKVGALLHELRIKQGLSVIEVAKRVGYSAEFVKMIEAEQVWPIEIGILLTFLDAMEYDWEIKPRPKNINEQLKASLKLEKKRKK